MRLLSALLDLTLLPVAVLKDLGDAIVYQNGGKSNLCQKIEDIEDNLKP